MYCHDAVVGNIKAATTANVANRLMTCPLRETDHVLVRPPAYHVVGGSQRNYGQRARWSGRLGRAVKMGNPAAAAYTAKSDAQRVWWQLAGSQKPQDAACRPFSYGTTGKTADTACPHTGLWTP